MSTNTESRLWQPAQVKIIDGKAVAFRNVVVHTIQIGDVEDPDLYVAGPIWDWQQSDSGKFVLEHTVEEPYWHHVPDLASYSQTYHIVARLSEQNETFWRLKYVDSKNRV